MAHVNRMVFTWPQTESATATNETFRLPFSCRLALILAAVPVLVLGVYVPKPLNDLLTLAAAAVTR